MERKYKADNICLIGFMKKSQHEIGNIKIFQADDRDEVCEKLLKELDAQKDKIDKMPMCESKGILQTHMEDMAVVELTYNRGYIEINEI